MLPASAEPLIFQGLAMTDGTAPKAEAAWRDAVRVAPMPSEPHYRLGRQEMDTSSHGRHRSLPQGHCQIPPMPHGKRAVFSTGQRELLTGSKSGALAAFQRNTWS